MCQIGCSFYQWDRGRGCWEHDLDFDKASGRFSRGRWGPAISRAAWVSERSANPGGADARCAIVSRGFRQLRGMESWQINEPCWFVSHDSLSKPRFPCRMPALVSPCRRLFDTFFPANPPPRHWVPRMPWKLNPRLAQSDLIILRTWKVPPEF
jgi:hypothetical protein